MFGEYAQVATFMQPSRNATYQNEAFDQDPLPGYLRPIYHPPQAWTQGPAKCGLSEDFIMIAEFSELEGPKPLMTIPKDGGANFDQNTFAVRILAVDHQNPTDGFSISEDTQVVMTDSEAGVCAFVHHLVLYDNTARGFVRPYCIAFITTDHRKLMCFYEELSWKFKKVARLLKYGNKMVFVGDLERHLKDLEYTKNVLLNQVCKIRLRHAEGQEAHVPDARRNAENELYRGLQSIQQSSLEIREILSVLKPLLPDQRLENRFRKLEERAYQGMTTAGLDILSLPESGFADLSAVDELDIRCGSLTEPRISPLALFNPREYKPVLVETKKARRFNAPLRGLHELCSWGAKEGLKKLRHIHMTVSKAEGVCFPCIEQLLSWLNLPIFDLQLLPQRDMTTLELEKNEAKLFRPRNASIQHGQCITGNFLTGVQMKRCLQTMDEADHSWSMLYSHNWSSLGSLNSEDSFKSLDGCPTPTGFTEASPSSFHTYESLNGPAFQSAASSPEKEFSFLTSDEYYPDLTSRHTETMTYTPAAPGVMEQRHEVSVEDKEHCQNCLREKGCVSRDSCCDKFSNSHVEKVSPLHVDNEALQPAENCNKRISDLNGSSLSAHLTDNVLLEVSSYPVSNEDIFHDSETLNSSSVDEVINMCSEGLNLDEDNIAKKIDNLIKMSGNILDFHKEIIDNCPAEKTQQENSSLSHCGNGFSNIKSSSQDGCCQGRSVTTPNSDRLNGCFVTGHSVDTSQSLSISLVLSSGKILQTNGHENINKDLQDDILTKEMKTEPSQQGTEHSVTKSPDYRKGLQKTEQIQRCDSMLSMLLEQEDKNTVVLGKLISEYPRRDTDKLLSSAKPVQISESKSTSVDRVTHKSSEIFVQQKSDGSNHMAEKSKLVHSSLQNYPQFAHQITSATREKPVHSDIGHSDDPLRARTESDASSAFTEISIHEVFPHLLGARSESKDGPLQEECEARSGAHDCIDIPTLQNTATWKPRCGLYTVGDWISNVTKDRPGYGLLETLTTYQYFEHVIFSLLSGRPVLVAGSAKLELEVIKLVNALAVFVPATKRKSHAVLEWTSKPIRITDLIKLKLIGVCRPERRTLDSFIPGAIKKACTIVDIEKRLIVAPPYQGQFVATLMAKRKVLKSDVVLLAYIEWWLMDILSKAFLFFHNFCLGSGGSILYSHSPKDQRDAYLENVSFIMGRLGVRDCDCEIIEHLTEMVKLSKLEHHVWQGAETAPFVEEDSQVDCTPLPC